MNTSVYNSGVFSVSRAKLRGTQHRNPYNRRKRKVREIISLSGCFEGVQSARAVSRLDIDLVHCCVPVALPLQRAALSFIVSCYKLFIFPTLFSPLLYAASLIPRPFSTHTMWSCTSPSAAASNRRRPWSEALEMPLWPEAGRWPGRSRMPTPLTSLAVRDAV